MQLNLPEINQQLEEKTAAEILAWAWGTFAPSMAASSSMQSQSLPLLHLISTITPDLPVFFLDTGFHFPETLVFRDELAERLGIKIISLKPAMGNDKFRGMYGDLYKTNPDLCCQINKIEPMRAALTGLSAWISGIRRDQTPERSRVPIVDLLPDGMYKVSPLANWTAQDIWTYIHDHNLPEHPLLSQGYLSIGCAPCTQPASAGENERSGRWAGQSKRECGLHIRTHLNSHKK